MLKNFKKSQEQWGGSSDAIDHWLDKRQQVVVEYCKIAALQPCSSNSSLSELPSPQELQCFCQDLVDYISEGHFKVYDMVMSKWQSTGFEITDDIHKAYAEIVKTTDPLLNFTDKYATVNEEDELEELDDDLSQVGETLESRFELEDDLIQLIIDSLSIPPGA